MEPAVRESAQQMTATGQHSANGLNERANIIEPRLEVRQAGVKKGRARRCAPAAALVREDQPCLNAVTVTVLIAKEQRRGVVVLDHEEAIVAADTEMTRREPLDAAPDVAGEVRFVGRDSERVDAATRTQRQPADATREIGYDGPVAPAGVHDETAVVGPHTRRSLICKG